MRTKSLSNIYLFASLYVLAAAGIGPGPGPVAGLAAGYLVHLCAPDSVPVGWQPGWLARPAATTSLVFLPGGCPVNCGSAWLESLPA